MAESAARRAVLQVLLGCVLLPLCTAQYSDGAVPALDFRDFFSGVIGPITFSLMCFTVVIYIVCCGQFLCQAPYTTNELGDVMTHVQRMARDNGYEIGFNFSTDNAEVPPADAETGGAIEMPIRRTATSTVAPSPQPSPSPTSSAGPQRAAPRGSPAPSSSPLGSGAAGGRAAGGGMLSLTALGGAAAFAGAGSSLTEGAYLTPYPNESASYATTGSAGLGTTAGRRGSRSALGPIVTGTEHHRVSINGGAPPLARQPSYTGPMPVRRLPSTGRGLGANGGSVAAAEDESGLNSFTSAIPSRSISSRAVMQKHERDRLGHPGDARSAELAATEAQFAAAAVARAHALAGLSSLRRGPSVGAGDRSTPTPTPSLPPSGYGGSGGSSAAAAAARGSGLRAPSPYGGTGGLYAVQQQHQQQMNGMPQSPLLSIPSATATGRLSRVGGGPGARSLSPMGLLPTTAGTGSGGSVRPSLIGAQQQQQGTSVYKSRPGPSPQPTVRGLGQGGASDGAFTWGPRGSGPRGHDFEDAPTHVFDAGGFGVAELDNGADFPLYSGKNRGATDTFSARVISAFLNSSD